MAPGTTKPGKAEDATRARRAAAWLALLVTCAVLLPLGVPIGAPSGTSSGTIWGPTSGTAAAAPRSDRANVSAPRNGDRIRRLRARRPVRPKAPPAKARATQDRPAGQDLPARTAKKPQGFDLTDALRYAAALVVLVLLWRWRRDTREDGDLERVAATGSAGVGRYASGPVHISAASGVDPATLRQEHTLVPIGLAEAAALQAAQDLDVDDPRAIAAEIDALTARPAEPDFKVKAPTGTGQAERKASRSPALRLTGELAAHFAGGSGERLEWQAELTGGGDQGGTVAFTNWRFLAVCRKPAINIWPPGVDMQIRRHQLPVAAIVDVRQAKRRQPAFLIAAGVTVLFFPVGTVLALAAVAGYVAVTRPELEIVTSGGRRRYALPPAAQEEARQAWLKIRETTNDANRVEPPGQAAG